jgi:hypothetical protein
LQELPRSERIETQGDTENIQLLFFARTLTNSKVLYLLADFQHQAGSSDGNNTTTKIIRGMSYEKVPAHFVDNPVQ